MTLGDLEQFNPILIQCHDNPDADALGSGYALYRYFKQKGKDVTLFYSGRNRVQKSNLLLMIEKLELPVEYVGMEERDTFVKDGLLITVDCQYGASNVTHFAADNVAIIDHHQVENGNVPLSRIRPSVGSCSTVVWNMMRKEGFNEWDDQIGTALYYGLYTDTNQFSELYNPLDLDMREAVPCDKSLISLFRNSNISLEELEVAGIAMLRCSYNEDYKFAVIKSQPCDPNILGLISDFLLQVDRIQTCMVFNEVQDGFKISVRSCVREVNASELAAFLTEGIGSGGGHYEKAGGFVSRKLYDEKFPNMHAEGYFNNRMMEYFNSFDLIYADKFEAPVSEMLRYQKKKVPIGYVKLTDVLPVGSPFLIRTLEGDMELTVEEDLYVIIGIKGEVYPCRKHKFDASYLALDTPYKYDDSKEYVPTIKSHGDGKDLYLPDYARTCVPTGQVRIFSKQLEKGAKIFTAWDKEKYMLGKPGDFLTVRCDDLHDVYIVEKDIFGKTYERVE